MEKLMGEIVSQSYRCRLAIQKSLLSLIVLSTFACSTQARSNQFGSNYRDPYIKSIIIQEPDLRQILEKKRDGGLQPHELPIWRAIGFLGTAYSFGGSDFDELDCSAFIQKIFSPEVNLPRSAYDQFLSLKKRSRLQPKAGDLVFFKTTDRRKRPVTHVGIMFNQHKFIHASTTQGIVSVADLRSKYWRNKVYAYVKPTPERFILARTP
jgi:hypothetical protein